MKTPAAIETERAALQALANTPGAILFADWCDDLFFLPDHQRILRTIRELAVENVPHGPVEVASRLERKGLANEMGGPGTIVANLEGASGESLAEHYRRELAVVAGYRKTFLTLRQNLEGVANMTADLAEVADAVARATASGRVTALPSFKSQIDGLIDHLEAKTPPERFGFGRPQLDCLLDGGVEAGELSVVAGETSGGKSVLLLQAALAAVQANKPAAVYSLEMSAKTVLRRMIANATGKPVRGIREEPTKAEVEATRSGIIAASKWPLTIRDGLTRLDEILADASRLADSGTKLIVVDYLQLIEHRADTREQAVSETTRRLKNLALRCGVAVVTASQMNENGQLRESRAIGQHADSVVEIGADDNGVILRTAKHRRGERGRTVRVQLKGSIARFEPAQPASKP